MNLISALQDYAWIAIVAVVIVLIVIIVCMFISYYNKFVKSRNNVEESFSAMDVHLKKRYDLIPNLVNTVKGYAKHEKDTLEAVINARNLANNSVSTDEKIKNEAALTSALKSLLAVAEQYPALQANANFIDLQNTLKSIEEEIAHSRKYYNARVKVHNTSLEVFPGVIFAKIFKQKKFEFFVVDDEKERKNIKVEF